jgi:hypothetical protein
MSHNHYFKDVSGLQKLDVYRVIELFDVPAGPIDHAVKKLLCAGNRGHKDLDRDIQDAIDSLVRWQAMRAEDAAASFGQQNTFDYRGQGGVMLHCSDCSAEHCPCVAA